MGGSNLDQQIKNNVTNKQGQEDLTGTIPRVSAVVLGRADQAPTFRLSSTSKKSFLQAGLYFLKV